MKCPKCGYVSFNYLDQCKKCHNDLVLFKEERHIWGIKPGNLKLYPLTSEDTMLEHGLLTAEEESGAPIVTSVEDKPIPILEEAGQDIDGKKEAIVQPLEEREEFMDSSESEMELTDSIPLESEGHKEFALEKKPIEFDSLFPEEEDDDEESDPPSPLLDESEQAIQLDLDTEEEPVILSLEEDDEAMEEPIILLEENDQSEEEILLGFEEGTDDLELFLDENEEEETK